MISPRSGHNADNVGGPPGGIDTGVFVRFVSENLSTPDELDSIECTFLGIARSGTDHVAEGGTTGRQSSFAKHS